MDRILGFNLEQLPAESSEEEESLSDELMSLIREREEARKNRDWKRADELRDILLEKGISVKDTPSGTVWTKNV